jgi:hypothetical protein
MLRGTVTEPWPIGALAALAVAFIGISWMLLRRAMRSA